MKTWWRRGRGARSEGVFGFGSGGIAFAEDVRWSKAMGTVRKADTVSAMVVGDLDAGRIRGRGGREKD